MRPNLIALVSLAAAPLSARHAPELLFNGSDLAGWHGQRHFSPYKLAEMSDEARHVAFGVLSLKEVYEQMTDAELKERQEFAYEAAIHMRDRFLSQEVWERMGVAPKDVLPIVLRDPTRAVFQRMLFSKVVPNCKKLGLLDRNQQWLRRRFEEMDVIEFEDLDDTSEEYTSFALGEEAPAPMHP